MLVLVVRGRLATTDAAVTVPDVEPECSVVGQCAAELMEQRPHGFDVGCGGFLQPILPIVAVIAEPVVGRARDDAVHGPGLKRAGHSQ